MNLRFVLTSIVCVPLLGACFLAPHKIDVQQGNYLDAQTVAKLKPDMTRSQVRFLMGTPLISDPFHPERWDYVYMDFRAGRLKQQKRLTLFFDGDQLKRALTDFMPAAIPPEPAKTAASTR